MARANIGLVSAAALTLSLGAFVIAGNAGAQGTMSVKDEMKMVVEPASNTVFGVGGEVDPENGPDAAKVPDARWKEGADAARKLKVVATNLVQPGRGKDAEDWKMWSRQLGDLSDAMVAAAAKKDGAAFAKAANDLGDNCFACHGKYKPQTG
jgi:hypothetical protein